MRTLVIIGLGLILAACTFAAYALIDAWRKRSAWRRADEEARRRLGLDDPEGE